MTYQYRPAVRGDAPLMLGLAGPSRSGKTYSALRIALGMTGDISKVFVLDTERGRSRQYVDRFGQFMHCDLEAPFTSEKYQEAINDAEKAGAVVIIVDSQSHEHEGPGGILEQHETELTRMAGATDWGKREKMKFSAWIKPKAAHNKFVNKMLQVNVHMIFCFRAKDKLVMVRNAEGKMEPVSVGWQPICADRFEYEMTGMLVLPPGSKGTPDLGANAAGLREPLDTMFKQGDQLTEETGKRLIEWANSGRATGQSTSAATGNGADPLEGAREAARQGTKAFQTWWNGDGKTQASRAAVKPHMDEMKDLAAKADASDQEDENPFGLPAENQSESANSEAAEPDAMTDRPFLADDGHAILYDGAGKEIGRYELAGNFFKAVKAQIPKDNNPRAFVERAAAAANHFVNKDEALMDVWDECGKAATDAEAARDNME